MATSLGAERCEQDSKREERSERDLRERQKEAIVHIKAQAITKLMKNTANSCMIVTTLIATMVFVAGFTVPGDNNGVDVALFSSIVSIIMFLSIPTSHHAEDDFLSIDHTDWEPKLIAACVGVSNSDKVDQPALELGTGKGKASAQLGLYFHLHFSHRYFRLLKLQSFPKPLFLTIQPNGDWCREDWDEREEERPGRSLVRRVQHIKLGEESVCG
ncbi:hypothetical protein H5410_057352 [Solanum commersonii]|uniref:PGG domain-containing protein n=1 Tax=Solanum commersonii TaxID=4109 RepID=A0A9J5WNS6_SOLCO|nr:hypothetical protein H5410_057352 [Solanum commersonii]